MYRRLLFLALVPVLAPAQRVTNAYNRDTNESFSLKSIAAKAVVKGPIVKQRTRYTYSNPYKKLTEASVWLDLDQGAVLGGFGYMYKNEYVPGVLMDKNKAWFIYTAITSRNEDPGIMVQTAPDSYHTQIYPLAIGYDLRVDLESVGFLRYEDGKLTVPVPIATDTDKVASQSVTSTQPQRLVPIDGKTMVMREGNPNFNMELYAQRFKDGYTYVAGMLITDQPDEKLKLEGIGRVYWVAGNDDRTVKYFIGRRKGRGTIEISSASHSAAKQVKGNERGSDAAKLWAHQRLIQEQWTSRSAVLKHSLYFGVPSTQTALLAVPQEQMQLFKQKEAEYRRKQRELARQRRQWQNQRPTNNSSSSGGDPEIRMKLVGAVKVEAILPDGKRFALRRMPSDMWGGNFSIPVNAPEGDYVVRIVATMGSGKTETHELRYEVDRTPPKGIVDRSNPMLTVKSEPGLAKVVAVFGSGEEVTMVEMTPGVYQTPQQGRTLIKVVLMDRAHNLAECK